MSAASIETWEQSTSGVPISDKLCHECLELLTSPEFRGVLNHKRTYALLEESIEQGCRLCSIFHKAWLQKLVTDPRGAGTYLSGFWDVDDAVRLAKIDPTDRLPFKFRVGMSRIGKSHLHAMEIHHVEFECILDLRAESASSGVGRIFVSLNIDLVDGRSDKIAGRVIPEQTDLSLCQRWVENCSEHHSDCVSIADHELPKWVIDVGLPDGSQTLKLVSGPEKRHAKYVALSHCWGAREPTVTTTTNLEDRLRGIDLLSLPKTFRDAVHVTRFLQFRYLWIDSLCILQDDSVDWQEQCPKMVSVYSKAAVTIAAAGAKDAFEGFLSPRTASPWSERIYLQSSDRDGVAILAVTPEIEPYRRNSMQLTETPPVLANRAWAFQERFLSPRVLYFGTEQMYFECNEGFSCESVRFPLLVDMEGPSMFNRNNYKRILPVARGDLLDDWYVTVRLYSTCRLTYSTDRLPALEGLAELYRERLGYEYCAGLWKEDLARGLTWSRSSPPESFERDVKGARRDAITDLAPDHFPSWSWASCNYPVSYRYHVDFTTSCSLHISSNQDQHESGQIEKLQLLVRGKVKPAVVVHDPLEDSTVIYDPDNMARVARACLDNPDFGAPLDLPGLGSLLGTHFTEQVECLHLYDQPAVDLQRILVLQAVNEDPGSIFYRRVGIDLFVEDREWFDDAPEREIRII